MTTEVHITLVSVLKNVEIPYKDGITFKDRSFSMTNTLILFEEIDGNPQKLSIQTITIGTICENANEDSKLDLCY